MEGLRERERERGRDFLKEAFPWDAPSKGRAFTTPFKFNVIQYIFSQIVFNNFRMLLSITNYP